MPGNFKDTAARFRLSFGRSFPVRFRLVSATTYRHATGRFQLIVVAPIEPALTAPAADATVRFDQSNLFSWTFQEPSRVGATQAAYALRRRNVTTGLTEWWDAAAAGWSATEVFNTTSTQSVTLAAGKWINYAGQPYAWTVATKDDLGFTGPYAAERAVSVTLAADPIITSPTGAPTAAHHTMTWTCTDQLAFRARLLAGATLIADSGKVYDRTTRTYALGPMASGTSYTFEITTWNADDYASAVVTTAKTPSYTQPSVPTLVGSNPAGVPKNRIVITNPGGGDTVVSNEVWRGLTGSGPWTRVATGVALNGTYDDYGAAIGVAHYYFVRAIGTSDTIRDSAVL